MARVDSRQGPTERQIFDYLAERLDIGPKTAERIWEHPETIDLKNPRFFEERKAVLVDVAGIMVADKRLDDGERALLAAFCEFLEFDAAKATALAEGLLSYSRGEMTPAAVEQLLEEF